MSKVTRFQNALVRCIVGVGLDYLTISWKIASDPFLCVHMEVEEKDKENKYEIGQSLEIGNMKFEDLDEIHAKYVEIMFLVLFHTDCLSLRCFCGVCSWLLC